MPPSRVWRAVGGGLSASAATVAGEVEVECYR